jgi:opacity protein-like surface antigen
MKRFLWLIPAILFLGLTAQAQETPAWEVSGGYSYLRSNLQQSSGFGLNGGYGSLSQNLNNWFGGRLEINGYGGTIGGTNISAQTFTYGPVFSYRRHEKITPFGEFALGAVHGSAYYLGISASAWKFALTTGGGIDYNINRRVAIRLKADYVMTTFLSLRQDNASASAGLVFRFGKK